MSAVRTAGFQPAYEPRINGECAEFQRNAVCGRLTELWVLVKLREMSVAVEQPRKVWTEAEIQALPDDGYIHEVVNGELVQRPMNDFAHEHLATKLLTLLRIYAKAHRLGAVLGSNFGCWMHNRNCRAPDISFISKARLLSLGFTPSTRKFFPGAPDLVVEILSPS